MIRSIIDSINDEFDYSFKDVHLGMVHPHSNKGMMIPMSSDGTSYPEAVPDSARRAIAYWEDYGAKTWRQTPRYRFIDHTVRFVLWMNLKKTPPYAECIDEIYRNIPRRQGNVLLNVVGQIPKGADIFARYGYQKRKQFITYPYDVLALTIQVKYLEPIC